jgi:gas vesicle protein
MSTGKVLLGVLAGITAGALLGILFAPEKGCETRKKIANSGKSLVDDLNDTLKEFMADVTDKLEAVLKQAKEPAEKES